MPNFCVNLLSTNASGDSRAPVAPPGSAVYSLGAAALVGQSGGGGSVFFDVDLPPQRAVKVTLYLVDYESSRRTQVIRSMVLPSLRLLTEPVLVTGDQMAVGVYASFLSPGGSLRFRYVDTS